MAKSKRIKPTGTAQEWETLWGAYIDALKSATNVEACRLALVAYDKRNGHASMPCYAEGE